MIAKIGSFLARSNRVMSALALAALVVISCGVAHADPPTVTIPDVVTPFATSLGDFYTKVTPMLTYGFGLVLFSVLIHFAMKWLRRGAQSA